MTRSAYIDRKSKFNRRGLENLPLESWAYVLPIPRPVQPDELDQIVVAARESHNRGRWQ